MTPIRLACLALTLLLAVLPAGGATVTNGACRCVAEVLVTAQRFNPRVPWLKERPVSREGYAVVVADGRLITTEDLVRNAVMIEIRRPGSAVKSAATLVQADPRANAALLAAPTTGLEPAAWDGPVKAGAKVQLVQYDDAGQAQSGEGRITEIAVAPLPSAPHSLLTFRVLTDLKLDRVGAPAFHEGALAGLVMQYDEASQTSEVLPAPVLRRFVSDGEKPPYQGVANAGLFWAPMVDPAKRRFHGLPEDGKGVLVLRTMPGGGAAAVLQPNDVITSWDGFDIDSQGYYNDPDFGRLSMPHLISGRRHPGDKVPVTVWRNRQPMSLTVTLDAYDDSRALVPMNTEGAPADYLVEGGLVLRELSADFLQAAGDRWMLLGNPRLVNLYLTRALFPDKPGDRIVILAGILPDPINAGYQDLREHIVTHVNGQPVSNLRQVSAVRAREGGLSRLTLLNVGADIVLDKAALAEANRRIARLYRIPL